MNDIEVEVSVYGPVKGGFTPKITIAFVELVPDDNGVPVKFMVTVPVLPETGPIDPDAILNLFPKLRAPALDGQVKIPNTFIELNIKVAAEFLKSRLGGEPDVYNIEVGSVGVAGVATLANVTCLCIP